MTSVLILVLVEDGLGLSEQQPTSGCNCYVLILVLVEDGLGRLLSEATLDTIGMTLNPCCDGRWSRTLLSILNKLFRLFNVLILVVMEYGLGHE